MMRSLLTVGVVSLLGGLKLAGAEPAGSEPGSTHVPALFAVSMLEAIETISERHVRPVSRAQLTRWATEGLYGHFKEPVPPEIQKRLASMTRPTDRDIVYLLRDVCAHFWARKKLDKLTALKICLGAIFARLEPGADDDTRSAFEQRDTSCILYLYYPVGIGLKIQSDPASGMLRVITPIHKGPAYKAGIRAGDLITHIQIEMDADGNRLDQVKVLSTKGMTVEQAYELFLGKEGTRISLRILPSQVKSE